MVKITKSVAHVRWMTTDMCEKHVKKNTLVEAEDLVRRLEKDPMVLGFVRISHEIHYGFVDKIDVSEYNEVIQDPNRVALRELVNRFSPTLSLNDVELLFIRAHEFLTDAEFDVFHKCVMKLMRLWLNDKNISGGAQDE